ncbi:DUF7159 family protein [Mycobacterium botniense]|uniref:DUF7159 family protein n=1 Tax=Mycobacterium botniense TaxID=84962 RepID=UPI0014797826|nr:hypothetical protein [Mycobacterium botniense]
MDLVLGVSMAPSAIQMVLIEGDNADGVTVEEDTFEIPAAHDEPMPSTADQVISAILGTREGATQAGCRLASTGVAWTDAAEASVLREALAARKIENVMLVSAFLAAAALAQTVGQAIGYDHIAMLFVEAGSATVGVVDCDDGSVTDVCRKTLSDDDPAPAQLSSMVSAIKESETRPQGVFVVGCGIDVAPIKAALETVTPLLVNTPEDPATALARGAALASANAPLFASATTALAYAQDPAVSEIDPYAFTEGYAGTGPGDEGLAYSAVPDEDAESGTSIFDAAGGVDDSTRRRPVLLVGSAAAAVFLAIVVALEISLAVSIRPTVALRPTPGQNLIVPAQQAPAPEAHPPVPPPIQVPARQPLAPPAPAVPAAPPAPIRPPVAPPPMPALPAPVPVAPIPVPPIPGPVHLPAPGAPVPPPPINFPVLQPPVGVPNPQPPVHVPTPPIQQPAPAPPPVHIPAPPVQQPVPKPPVNLPAPEPPMNVPAPEPPIHMPAPEAPPIPAMPAPEAPHIPVMPAPEMPHLPVMPGPALPPVIPRIPLIMPRFGL